MKHNEKENIINIFLLFQKFYAFLMSYFIYYKFHTFIFLLCYSVLYCNLNVLILLTALYEYKCKLVLAPF